MANNLLSFLGGAASGASNIIQQRAAYNFDQAREAARSRMAQQKLQSFIDAAAAGDSDAKRRLDTINDVNNSLSNSFGLKVNPLTGDLEQATREDVIRAKIEKGIISAKDLSEQDMNKFLSGQERSDVIKERVLERVGVNPKVRSSAKDVVKQAVVQGPDGGFIAGTVPDEEVQYVAKSVESLKKELATKGLEIDPTRKDFALRDIKTKDSKIGLSASQALNILRQRSPLTGKPIVDELDNQIPGLNNYLEDIVKSSMMVNGDFTEQQMKIIKALMDRNKGLTMEEAVAALKEEGYLNA